MEKQFCPRKIAVWNTAFLGDAVLTLPLIQALHTAWPEAEIHFYTRRGFAPLFAEHPALAAVYEYDKRGGAGALGRVKQLQAYGRELRGQGYDLWVSAHRSARSGYLARASRAAVRLGYSTPWFNRFFYTATVDRCFADFDEVDRLLRLLLPLRSALEQGGLERAGLEFKTHENGQVYLNSAASLLWPQIHLPGTAEKRAEELLAPAREAAAKRGGKLLGLHPGSVWATKRWPVEYFAALGATALEQGHGLVLFAGPGEEEMARQAEELIRSVNGSGGAGHTGGIGASGESATANAAGPLNLVNLGGALSLPELAACIKRLGCYVTNDSGPMHLAWAQRVPLAALFGPTVRSLGFAPRGETSRLFEVANLSCRPCGLHGPARCPKKHHNCMRELRPELVWPQVRQLLGGE